MPHKQTTKILSAWINSCITEEQLITCREAISEFFIKRFAGEIHEVDYEHDLNTLYGLVHKREAFINSQPKVTAMPISNEDNHEENKFRELEHFENRMNEHFDTAHDTH